MGVGAGAGPEGAPTGGGAPVDDADAIGGGGGSGIDVVLDEVVEVEFVDLDEDRLVATEFVVFAVVVAIIDTSIDVVAVLVGAVVAGGATTVPLLKLTAPKLEVKAAVPVVVNADIPGEDVGVI